jgi:hypothetical protein
VGPWDYKARAGLFQTTSCPSSPGCRDSVTLCKLCLYKDVPGNINYGFVGRAAGINGSFLLSRAAAASPGGVDTAEDTAAITIGMDLWDQTGSILYLKTNLCTKLQENKEKLEYDKGRTKNCPLCPEKL